VARALRTVEQGSGAIAVSDIIRRLDDPDYEVREEAARALGRIGSSEAVEPLLRHLEDRHSTIRMFAARALGRIGDARAIPALVDGLESASEEMTEACCQALGRMGARQALKALLHLLGEEHSQRVIVAAGQAMSRLGAFEAALDILPRMHATDHPVLLRQYAIAMGNLLGRPGEFYAIVTADSAARSTAMEKLRQDAQKNLQALLRASFTPQGARELRDSLLGAARRLRAAAATEDNALLLRHLHETLISLCRFLAGRAFTEDEALAYAFLRNPALGLGVWFATEVVRRVSELKGSDLLEIDALLGMYFLAAYRETKEEEE
jgi:HEAT repeat protein